MNSRPIEVWLRRSGSLAAQRFAPAAERGSVWLTGNSRLRSSFCAGLQETNTPFHTSGVDGLWTDVDLDLETKAKLHDWLIVCRLGAADQSGRNFQVSCWRFLRSFVKVAAPLWVFACISDIDITHALGDLRNICL
eukprot:gene8877-9789_t